MSDSGLHFLIGPIFTACLYLSVAGPMRNQAESAGQELISFFFCLLAAVQLLMPRRHPWNYED